MSGGPRFALALDGSPGTRNAIDELLEDARLLGDDVIGRPAPNRDRVDPGDDRGDQHCPGDRLEVGEEPEAERRERVELGEVEEHVEVREPEEHRQDGEREPDEADAAGSSRAGGRARSRPYVAGKRTSDEEADVRLSGRPARAGRRPLRTPPARASRPRERAPSSGSARGEAQHEARAQYGGSSANQGPTALKAFQKAVFAGASSSAASMSGTTSASIVAREALQALDARVERIGEREVELVDEAERLLAHHDDELRLDDVQLARAATAAPPRDPGRRTSGSSSRRPPAGRPAAAGVTSGSPGPRGRRRRRPPGPRTAAGSYLSRKTSASGWPEPARARAARRRPGRSRRRAR